MKENYPIDIELDISKLDDISRIVLEESWLKELKLKLDLLTFDNNQYNFSYIIKENKIIITIKSPDIHYTNQYVNSTIKVFKQCYNQLIELQKEH